MKTYTVILGTEASHDLDSLYAYIAERAGETTAQRFVDRLRRFCLGLSLAPKRGLERGDPLPGLRLVGFQRRATVGFLIEEDCVVILRIMYRGRDIEAEF